jgi:hypothetical protein
MSTDCRIRRFHSLSLHRLLSLPVIEQCDPLFVIVKQVSRVLVIPSDSVCRENETM